MVEASYPPLSGRVMKAKSNSLGYVPPLRRSVYKDYTAESLKLAIKAVANDGHSIRRAAEEYQVPKSTLGDHVKGRVLAGAVGGRQRYLNETEEQMLVDFLIKSAELGFPRSRKEVIGMVQNACDYKGLGVSVSHGWWKSFCKRNQGLSLRVASALSRARYQGSNREALEAYFDTLEETLTENDLLDKPCRIFNMDESGLPLVSKPPKLLCKTGTRAFNSVTGGDKSHITVVGCVSAGGYCLPPMVIYDRKTLQEDMVKGEIGGTLYGLSSKGWIDEELFRNWFQNHFLRYIPPDRPVILLMDGHSTHYSPQTMLLAAKEGVVLFTLPPNTTHLTQPLDRGCFSPLKSAWRQISHEFTVKTGKAVTRYTFSELFAKAWMNSMTMSNIISGFRCCGVYPVDRSKLIPVQEDDSNQKSLRDLYGVYVPLLSPSRRSGDTCVQTNPAPTFNLEEIDEFLMEPDNQEETGGSDDVRKFRQMYLPSNIECSSIRSVNLPYIHSPVKRDKGSLLVGAITVATTKPVSELQRVFKDQPKVPKRCPQINAEKSSRVLTSSESIKILQEKLKKKEEKQKVKEEKQKKKEERSKQKKSQPSSTSI